jgi:hypothetical protein
MDALNDVLGATIDGARLNLADGLLRLVLHLVTDDGDLHWEIHFKGISGLHVDRVDAERWDGAVISEIVVTDEVVGVQARLGLSSEKGSLSVSCGEIEVVPMGLVEIS